MTCKRAHTAWKFSAFATVIFLPACSTFDDGVVDLAGSHQDSIVNPIAYFSNSCEKAEAYAKQLEDQKIFNATESAAASTTSSGLLVGLLPGLVDKGISFTASALKKAGEESVEEATAATSGSFYTVPVSSKEVKLSDGVKCITMQFTKIEDSSSGPKNHAPVFRFEGLLEPSPDKTAFRIRPVHFEYNRNLGRSWFGQQRDVVITFTFSTPGTTATGTALGLTSIVFKNLKPIATFNSPQVFTGMESTYVPLPAVSADFKTKAEAQADKKIEDIFDAETPFKIKRDELTEELAKNQHDSKPTDAIAWQIKQVDKKIAALHALATGSDDVRKAKDSLEFSPVNLSIKFAETRHGNEYLVALGEALEGTKAPIKSSIEGALAPDDEQAKIDKAKTDVLEKRVATDIAKANYDTAKNDPATAPAALALAEGTFKKAVLAENVAARAAGLLTRYEDPI